jgi:hypothetical protein
MLLHPRPYRMRSFPVYIPVRKKFLHLHLLIEEFPRKIEAQIPIAISISDCCGVVYTSRHTIPTTG